MNDLFFYTAKFIWWGMRPDTLIILSVLLIFILLLIGWKKSATWAAGLLSAFLFAVGFMPVGNIILSPLERDYPVAPPLEDVAGIIVLGGGERGAAFDLWGEVAVNEGGERLILGAMLARQHPDARLVFTGGSFRMGLNHATPESEVARRVFMGLGIDEDRLILEGRSRNTAENAALTRPLLDQFEGNWVLVTSAYHMPRSLGTFCQAGFRNLIPYPVDHHSAPWKGVLYWQPTANIDGMTKGAKEWVGLLAYYLTGRTPSFWPTGC